MPLYSYVYYTGSLCAEYCASVTDGAFLADMLQSLGFSASLMDSSTHKDSMYLEHRNVIARFVKCKFIFFYLVQCLLQHLLISQKSVLAAN